MVISLLLCICRVRVPTLPGKPGIVSFTFPGQENALNFFKKWEKPGILTQNLKEKKLCKYAVYIFTFQDVIYRKRIIYIYVITALSTQTMIRTEIDLGLYCFYPEITWNCVSPEKWEPW